MPQSTFMVWYFNTADPQVAALHQLVKIDSLSYPKHLELVMMINKGEGKCLRLVENMMNNS